MKTRNKTFRKVRPEQNYPVQPEAGEFVVLTSGGDDTVDFRVLQRSQGENDTYPTFGEAQDVAVSHSRENIDEICVVARLAAIYRTRVVEETRVERARV